MIVRLGYVAISNKLGNKVTTSRTVTYKTYQKIESPKAKLEKLLKTIELNLNDLKRILIYNKYSNIHFYRITSKLFPLSTHPEVGYYGHREIFKEKYIEIGDIIKNNSMRVDTHPDQFNVINSTNAEVVKNTIKNLMEHVNFFEDIGYDDGKMVIHVGGAVGGKEEGINRFINNFNNFPDKIKKRIILENDDKIYNIKDILCICKELKIPMVLDVHHHNCNKEEDILGNYLGEIFYTWNKERLVPKIHFSSPREFENDRKHSDYISASDFNEFLYIAKKFDRDFDVMLECKEKDMALIQLVEDLKEINKEIIWIDESTLKL